MGQAFDLEPDRIASQKMHDLKELHVSRCALIKESARLRTRTQTQTSKLVKQQGQARADLIKSQIGDLDQHISRLINQDQEQKRKSQILRSVPGLGNVVAAAILTFLPEIDTLSSKQAASLAGLAPYTQQSGTWRGKAHISGGRKPLRVALYMPALVAMRFNPDLKHKYQALRTAGKPPKVALVALIRKLIITANALVRDNRTWSQNSA